MEWEEAVVQLRKFVEELIELKAKMVLQEMSPNKAVMS